MVKPARKRRDQLDAWFSGPEGPQALFASRILAFGARAGLSWAELMADGKTNGRPRGGLGAIIAAIAIVKDFGVVTDNKRDFAGIEIIKPLRGEALWRQSSEFRVKV